jgi:hypothetical protein
MWDEQPIRRDETTAGGPSSVLRCGIDSGQPTALPQRTTAPKELPALV